MKGPPLGPGGEDITWPDQVAPRGRKASSTRNPKPQTSSLREDIRSQGVQGRQHTPNWLQDWAAGPSLSNP